MKKLKTFLTLSLCLVAMFMFVGCCGEEEQPTLSTPTNTTISNDKVVKFDVVANATYYVINVNGINYYAYLNATPQISTVDSKVNYDAKDIMHQNTTYVVKVKAGANGYKESEFGTEASFVNSVKLNKTSVEVIGTTATWETVENADYYNIKIVLPTDEENEGQANLVTYKVKGKNYFDFSSVLEDAGEYKISVSAGSFNNYFLESDYSDATTKSTYKNYITLTAPQNIKIHKDNGNYYLLAVVDENTTDLHIVVDETDAVVPLTSEHVAIDEKLTNYVKINLSTLFTSADFTKNKDYSFAVQSMGGNYFVKSETAETNLHLNYATLQATQASYDATTRVLTWVASTDENTIGYNIYVATTSGVEKNYCSKESTQYMLPENFISAYVQVVGKDATIKNSLFSNAISKSSASLGEIQIYKAYRSEEGTIQPVTSGEFNCLSWSPIAGAKYLVEFANAVIDIGNSFYVPIDSWKEDYGTFVLHAYKNEFKEITRTFVLTEKLTLTSPKNLHVEIESPTVLKFDASVGALGYKLYVTDKAEAEAKWEEICEEYVQDSSRQLAFNEYLQNYAITKLFATNEIDAKPYINTIGAYKMFVQAMADPYSVYNNSKIKYEDGINVSLFYTLETPTFFKNAQGEIAPVEEVTMSSGKHYILKFYGTEGANVYEVFIKYGIGAEEKLTVQHDDRTGYYSLDITNNLVDGGEYTIKVRARYTGDDALILPSSYAQHTYIRIVQLNKVTGINVSVSGAKILTFDEQEHAYGGYKVEITKVGESYPLPPFVVASSGTNIGGYLSGKGNFCVTITALGKPEGYTQETYYTDSEAVSYYFTI